MNADQASHSSTGAPPHNMKRIVPWLVFVIFFAVLNETVFNVSTPNIASQFQLQPTEVSWSISIFIIFFGLGSVIYGKLSDIFRIRKLIVLGIIIYNLGSIIGFLGQEWYPAVITGRAIQGAGASAVPALVMILVARYFTPEERGKLFGIITSAVSFSVGIGPVLGGFIAGSFHWSYLFLIPFFSLISIPFFMKHLPHEEKKTGKMDVLGAILLGIGISAMILYLTELYWPFLIVSLVALAWFILHIRRVEAPFVEPVLFKNKLYKNGLVVGFIVFCTVMGIMFVMPLMLHNVYQLNTDTIGLVMFPGAISAVIFGTIGGNLVVKKGSNYVVYIGLILLVASLLLISSLVGMNVWLTSGALILMYIGFSFIQTALAESVTRVLPMERIGVGMGFFSLISFVSGAVGTAVVGNILARSTFSFSINPIISEPSVYVYSNLLLLFAIVICLSGIVYLGSFGRAREMRVQHQPKSQ